MAKLTGRQFDRQVRRRYRSQFGRTLDTPAEPTWLPQARKDDIADLAAALADAHWTADRFDPAALARHNRISLSFGPYGDTFDGMLEHRAGRFHIYANLDRVASHDTPRARFTLAHELGHYTIDNHRLALAAGRAPAHRSTCDHQSPNLAEQEADHFAANMLMPASRFVPRAKRVTVGLEGILELALAFGTSLTSTAIRYAAADIAPCAIVKWQHRRYAWKWLSSATFASRFRRTVEAPDQLPPDSPTALALAGAAPTDRPFHQAGTTAAAWFPRVQPGEYRDVILIEQAVSLGRYGVLTFLTPHAGHYDITTP